MAPSPIRRRRFTVDEYHRMAEAGILGEDDRVELLDGEVVQMMPVGPRHAGGVARLTRLFTGRLGERVIVWIQNPIVLGTHWEPEPDLALLRPREDFYSAEHPGPGDVLLVVEVAETSLERDRRAKLPAYAQAGVPEVWLVDLAGEGLEVLREPLVDGYRAIRRLGRGERIAPGMLPDIEFVVEELLGEA